ncbi:hypothetical protein [Enterococcus wangshanyuanii]|uniref:Phage head-tail adapter protein n=1 Tax=Enterococcus wangshanyuanii TaxID=2005703 RepID=A0ABQ1PU47_9ENTE|nr:hypothetical protein [Enterococcus wangshanyuanii]GGD03693.1 hypothetical protein GCM10011573_36440 [Enterococcus wangshanyuanii]
MRLFEVALKKKQKIDTDKLGNPIYELTTFKTGKGRKSIWTVQEIALDSRIVSKKMQKIITTLSREQLLQASHLSLKGETFSIEEIKGEDEDRWRILSVISYGK